MIGKVKDDGSWTVPEILKELRAVADRIEGHRLSVTAEERERLLPLLIILRKLTKRKKPGFHESLESIGLNASTVRSWFYRGLHTDEIIAMLKPESEEKPAPTEPGVVPEPDINVIAAELVRDIGSATRKEKLEAVVRDRNRLNPTIRKKLITALRNAGRDAAAFDAQLSKDFREFPRKGKAHQRVIREQMAQQSEPDLEEKRKLAADFKNAVVREISYDEAKNMILANEWLGNLGTTEFSYGLFFGPHLAGVCCFGRTGGTKVASSVCGEEHANKVVTLCRGACVHWSHPHSASFLISEACRQMTKKGRNVFVAYSDPAAGEIGTIYQASNFLYCGMTNPTEKFRTPDGKVHDSRQVHCMTRDRTGGTMKYKRTRAEQKQILLSEGCEFFSGTPKHCYVGIHGDRRIKRVLRKALRLPVLPYPKRVQAECVAGDQKKRMDTISATVTGSKNVA